MNSRANLDLISPEALCDIGVTPRLVQGKTCGIQIASDELVVVKECTDLQVNVAGVGTRVTAYVTGLGVSYDLLLSRRWIENVDAVEEYQKRQFTIGGSNGHRIEVSATLEEDMIKGNVFKPKDWIEL